MADSRFQIPDTRRSVIRDQESGIWNLESGFRLIQTNFVSPGTGTGRLGASPQE